MDNDNTTKTNEKLASSSAVQVSQEDRAVPAFHYKEGHVPETDANFFSKLIFSWPKPLFRRAAELRRSGLALQHSDLLPLPSVDHGKQINPIFTKEWTKQKRKQTLINKQDQGTRVNGVSKNNDNVETTTDTMDKKEESELELLQKQDARALVKSLQAVVGRKFVLAGFIKFLNSSLQFTFPILLQNVLKFIEEAQTVRDDDDNYDKNKGYWLSALLCLAMVCKAITESAYFFLVTRAGYQSRVAVGTAVYGKSLRLASADRQLTTLGELVNLLQVDATKIEMFVMQYHVLWDGLLQICGYMTILYTLIGWPCFAGLAIMVMAGPLQGIIMKRLYGLNQSLVTHTDQRVKDTNETLQGIRCVKMYTWEDNLTKSIANARSEELKFLKKSAYLKGASRSYMSSLPGIVAVVSFTVYAIAIPDASIKASKLFAALVAFDQLRFPLLFYPMALAQLAQAQVSVERVSAFLGLKELSSGRGKNEKVTDESDLAEDAEVGRENGQYFKNCVGGEQVRKGEIHLDSMCAYWSDPSVPIQNFTDKSVKSDDGSIASGVTEESNENQRTEESLKYPTPVLIDISLKVAPGELCAVVGRVGCGKSSLCSAILNETVLGNGNVKINGTVAYAAQSPWILNSTLRENILFGKPMDKERYDRVIEACQLTHDLSILDSGDLTEIGERGINLSGGQKQRVSVARAAYANADIIILDDPLSALDPEVGAQLFQNCILGDLMRDKTRILVTNQLQCLRFCDTVVALSKKGRVMEQGTFQELNEKSSGGEVQRILKDLRDSSPSTGEMNKGSSGTTGNEGIQVETTKEEEETEAEVEEEKLLEANSTLPKEKDSLVTTEERNVGAVAMSTYLQYLKAGGGYRKFIFVYFTFILCAGNGLMNTVWLSVWTSDSTYENHPAVFYLGIYALSAVSLGIFTFWRSFYLVRFGVRASENLHKNLLTSIMHAPMSFFDTTPTGRIISRFSKDMYSIDLELNDQFDMFLFMTLAVVVSLGTILFVTPIFGAAILPIAFLYFRILNYFRDVSRESKRLESISRSPVYAHFSETLGGLDTIRAYGQSDRFINNFGVKIDHNTQAYYCTKAADRWLAVRLELIGSLTAGLAAVLAVQVVLSDAKKNPGSDSNFASLAGISLTSAIALTALLNWVVRTFAYLEAAMNCCERVLYYTESIPQEASSTASALQTYSASEYSASVPAASSDPSAFAVVTAGGKVIQTTPDWPEKGEIILNNLFMKYREETPFVLKGLSVTINGGERIGIVGRTGSGKSSLMLCLMRIVEPNIPDNVESYEAPIIIDGVDVLRTGLYDLRSKLGIIPQNPALFSGNVRDNLDPFDDYTDEQIWGALEGCGMKSAIEAMPDMLHAAVAEYGENLSQGQRQLLCLGRALLKQCRILLLDEATSSVDFETDREIQRTLREAFAGCTVLTVAHRVNTIMDSDKILVMKDGSAVEFAPPEELLNDGGSLFAQIVRHAKAEHN